jgi:hypothetical protein
MNTMGYTNTGDVNMAAGKIETIHIFRHCFYHDALFTLL